MVEEDEKKTNASWNEECQQLFSLAGETVLITGAFSGLGLYFANLFLKAGARVAMAGRRLEQGRALAAQLQEGVNPSGVPRVAAFRLDVTSRESAEQCLLEADVHLGSPTILINNAGITETSRFLETGEVDWNGVINTNLNGVWRLSQCFAARRQMQKAPGVIVNVASILGIRVAQQLAAYSVSKAAVLQLTKAMALELARYGIRVNALAPGYFVTDLNREFMASESGMALINRIPLRRLGELEELAGPMLLLASRASSFMTGSVLVADGGHSSNSL